MLVDTHAHLDFPDFDDDRDAVIERALAEGVGAIITVGTDLDASRKAVAIAEQYPAVFASVGLHPNESASHPADADACLRALAARTSVVAIGETGLDYYRDRAPRDAQRGAFVRQIDLAIDLDLPVIVHSRESIDDCIDILRAYASPPTGVFHCFSGDEKAAKDALDLGFSISFAGPVSFPKAPELREVARTVPLDRMLVETDCPFLAPQPVRGRRNEPAFARHTAEALADVLGLPLTELAVRTTENACALFALDVEGRQEAC